MRSSAYRDGPSIKSPGLAAGRILILDRRNPIRRQRVADNRVPTFRIGGSPHLAPGYFSPQRVVIGTPDSANFQVHLASHRVMFMQP